MIYLHLGHDVVVHPLELRVDEDHAVARHDDGDVAAVLPDLRHGVVRVLDDVDVVRDLDQPRPHHRALLPTHEGAKDADDEQKGCE